jgi:phage shock protein PspC (stress-responsive transcriptional regulator)
MVSRARCEEAGDMTTSTPKDAPRLLRRQVDEQMLAGVAAGVARYFELDPLVVRIGFVALCLIGGAGVPLYVAAWLLIPAQGSERSVADDLLDHVGA